MKVGRVGELRTARDVAHRIDAPVACSQRVIDGNPAFSVSDTRLVEAETLDVRPPSRRNQQMTAFNRFLAGPAVEHHTHLHLCLLHTLYGHSCTQSDAFTRQLIDYDRRTFTILPA